MSTTATVPIVDPNGKVWDIPYENMHDALSKGGKLGVYMKGPDSSDWVIPADRVAEATKSGGKVVPYNLDGSHQKDGFWKTLGSDLGGMLTPSGLPPGGYPNTQYNPPAPDREHMFTEGPDIRGEMAQQAATADRRRKASGYGPTYRALAPVAESAGTNVQGMEDAARQGDEAGVYGHAAAPVAAYAAVRGGTAAAQAGLDALPSAERAGQNFSKVSATVGDHPIDFSGPGNQALEIQRLAESGGAMPKVIRDFVKRVTDPNKPALTYDEARNFYTNASRLSADEAQRLTPTMKRQLGIFTNELGTAIQDVAARGGRLQDFQDAMNEYRRAAKLREFGQTAKGAAVQAATKYVPPVVGGAIAGKLVKDALSTK